MAFPAAGYDQTPISHPTADAASKEIDFRELVKVFLNGKWIILACAMLGFIAASLHARTQPVVYRGDTLLQIEQSGQSTVLLSGLGLATGGEVIDAEIEIIRSRMVAGMVVDALDLDLVVYPVAKSRMERLIAEIDAKVRTLLRRPVEPEIVPTIAVGRFDIPAVLLGEVFTIEAGSAGTYTLYHSDGQRLLNGRVGESAVISLGNMGAGEPLAIFVSEMSAPPGTQFQIYRRTWLSAVNSLRGSLGIAEVVYGTGIVQVSMEGGNPSRIETILNELARQYVSQNRERRSAEAQQSLEFLNQQLPILRERMDRAEQEFNRFRTTEQAVNLATESTQLLMSLSAAESRYGELELERVNLTLNRGYGELHPQVLAIDEQMRQWQATIDDLAERINRLPVREQELLQLQRELEVARQLYSNLVVTASNLEVAQAGTVGSVRIVDTAAVGTSPIEPRSQVIAMFGGVLGLGLGIGIVLLSFLLRSTVEEPEMLEGRFGLPVYAVIPHSNTEIVGSRRSRRRAVRPILAVDAPQDITVESLRSLRTSLHFALLDETRKVVMVTSPGPGSGKSFLCTNLAWLIADSGSRVLLIDADLRRGHLHYYAGRSRKPGLTEVLAGQITLAEAAVPLREGASAYLLPSGMLPPNPSELLMGAQFQEMLRVAKTQYDIILIDTPPILAVTDAAVTAPHAGAVFLLVRAGVTRMGEIGPAITRLRQNGAAVTGFVVNDLRRSQAGASSYYYYQYSTRQ